MEMPDVAKPFESILLEVHAGQSYTGEPRGEDTAVRVEHRPMPVHGGPLVNCQCPASGPEADQVDRQITVDFEQIPKALQARVGRW
jgi:hypothetical protein